MMRRNISHPPRPQQGGRRHQPSRPPAGYGPSGTRLIRQLLLALSLSVPKPACAQDDGLRIYSVPEKAKYDHHNSDFMVRVRKPGGVWRDLYEYLVTVDLNNPQRATMVSFDMDGPVEVAVQKNNGDVRHVEVRPRARGITAKLAGRTAYFRLNRPENLSIEFDGDRLHNLHLFASAIDRVTPDPADPNVIWFGPGVHLPPSGAAGFVIPSGKTVYIAGGALLKGQIRVKDARNVRILGHGIIDQPDEGIRIEQSRDVLIDGPIMLNSGHYSVFCGESSGVTIQNFRAISSATWSDGLDFMSCSNVTIDNVFLRNSDDNIAVYADRWNYHGDARNMLVINATLWADVAHPINIGLHGNDKEPRVIEKLVFRNIDVLEHQEHDPNYQGVIAISNSDNNLVRDLLFEQFRIESVLEGMLFNFRVLFNDKYSLAPGRGIESVRMRNIHFSGETQTNRPVISGYGEGRVVRNVSISNVMMGKKALRRTDVDVGPWVEGLAIESRRRGKN